MARPFAPSLLPPWTIAASTIVGGLSAWVAVAVGPGLANRLGVHNPLDMAHDGLVLLCVWVAATHGFAAYLHSVFARHERSLTVWAFLGSAILPGGLLWWAASVRLILYLEAPDVRRLVLAILPSILAVPAMLAIEAAERVPVPGRALAAVAAALSIPWFLGAERRFATSFVAALTLSAVALGLVALSASRRHGDVRVVRGAASYRASRSIAFVVVPSSSTDRALVRAAVAAGFVAALGAIQFCALLL
jgi:hypothetical protein